MSDEQTPPPEKPQRPTPPRVLPAGIGITERGTRWPPRDMDLSEIPVPGERRGWLRRLLGR